MIHKSGFVFVLKILKKSLNFVEFILMKSKLVRIDKKTNNPVHVARCQ